MAEANRRGHEIRLVVPAEADRVEPVGEFGRIYHVQASRAFLNPDYRIIYPSQFVSSQSKVQKILAAECPDVIEVCDKYTLNYLGALLRMGLVQTLNYRPVVVGVSQERMDDNVRAYFGAVPLAQVFCSTYMKWLYFPFFDHHIANSEYTAAELRSAARGQLVSRGTWIRPMGVDLGHLSPNRRRPELRRRLLQNFGADEDAILLLYAGRLVPEKNLALLFDVLARLAQDGARDYRLLVVGGGIERDRWESKCTHELPGRALFFGHIRDKNVLADLYANADVFVHPNPREPFGIAPLEAMASGVPLVAPNLGGVVSYANMENAWTVDPDVESFAAAVREASSNRILAAEKTGRAIATAQHYRWETVAPSFLDLYEELHQLSPGNGQSSEPAFSSIQARGFQAALMRGVALAARASFRLWSKLASDSPSQRPTTKTNPEPINSRPILERPLGRTGSD
jgi:alpha-1,6-mannosyltransferase